MKKISALLIFLFFINGCATVEQSGLTTIAHEEEKKEPIEVKAPLAKFRVGEKLTYVIRWLGIPMGTAVFHLSEITSLNGREAYHIIYTGKSNSFASAFYKVNDEMHSYIDLENLCSLKFEKHLREGGYKVDEVIEYDQVNHKATYKSVRSTKKKIKTKDIEMPIPERVQDPFSCLYYFRTLSAEKIKVGQSIPIMVNTDEKNWELNIDVLNTKRLELLNMGIYDAVLLEPKAKFQGIFIRKGRMWVWVSTDERRLPLILRTKIPIIGSIYASLEKIE